VYDYDIKKSDYFLRHRAQWEVTKPEYAIEVGGKRYHLPSGIYLFCGCEYGSTDWVLIDEIINRDIPVFQMDNDFQSWELHQVNLSQNQSVPTELYLPVTKSPLPVSDVSGTRCIIIAYHDMYHKLKDLDATALFVF
jgi:hypothetical protein